MEPRPTCYDCFRPQTLCICTSLSKVDNKTRVTIVQHPRERLHPLNTARIAEGSLANVNVLRGTLHELAKKLEAGAIPNSALLLYPGQDAVDLDELPPESAPEEIVILDGTWHHASTLLRDLPVLSELRLARFTPKAPSEYQIRKEPRADYLSTIESIAHVLGLLEPETRGIETLRDSFRLMVRKNIDARAPAREVRRARRRGRGYAFPDELGQPALPPAVVYAEGAHLVEPGRGQQPLVVCVARPETGEETRLLLRPNGEVRSRLLRELRVSPEQLRAEGRTREQARDELRLLLTGHQAVAWNASTFRILEELGVAPTKRLFLKAIYCDFRRSLGDRPLTWGSMSEILEQRGIDVPREPGRAEGRLAQTLALYRYLIECAKSSPEHIPSPRLRGSRQGSSGEPSDRPANSSAL